MFTIKHIVGDGGETLHESERPVTFQPTSTDCAMVYWTAPDSEIRSLDVGVVYVMNKFGATVAKYDLSPPLHGSSRAAETPAT